MKIIILGAGQVGTTLAEHLATEHNDITIIDLDGERLRSLQERMDILTITGHGAHPDTLARGGANEADMLIAVTSSDETNLVACQVAYTLFKIPTKIARIRSLQYLIHKPLLEAPTGFPIDVLISPEQLVTDYVRRLIEHPNALQVFDFAEGRVQLVSFKVPSKQGQFVGQPIQHFMQEFAYLNARVASIYRQGSSFLVTEQMVIEPGDELFLIAAREHVRTAMSAFIHLDPPNRRIMIAGGGNIGRRLAATLEEDYQIKVIEQNTNHVETLATQLDKTVVLHGDASDKELLLSENIEDMDVFCAMTNHDETNVLSAILAKRLRARKVMALITRPSYLEVVEDGEIDIVVSPQHVTIGSLLTHVRRGHIVNVHSLRRGFSEAIEIIIHGSHKTSQVIGRELKDIPLPRGATIGALVRDKKVFMAHHNVTIEPFDRVIVFLMDKRKVNQVERLFQEEETP